MLAEDIKIAFKNSVETLSSISGVYVNEATEYRLSQDQLSKGKFGLRVARGDAEAVSYDLHWFLKRLFLPLQANPQPVRVAILFKGWQPRHIATIVVDIESVYWDSCNYPRIDLHKPYAMVKKFLGSGGFWGGFILAIAKVTQDIKMMEELDPTLNIFTELVRTCAIVQKEETIPKPDKCVSAYGANCDSPVTDFCFKCGDGMCAGHIFECRECGKNMCHKCWTDEGKDLCPDCKVK